jgi:hypothetical protein
MPRISAICAAYIRTWTSIDKKLRVN